MSELLPVLFEVALGLILGPVLFNLYMADLQNDKFDCNYLQYTVIPYTSILRLKT